MRTFLFICAAALSLTSCKKDKADEPEEGQLHYDGGTYNIEKGLIWDYKDHIFSSHYTQSYYVKNGMEFSSWGTQTLGPNDPPITLYYMLSSPGTASFKNGTFKCIYSQNYADWQINGLPNELKNEFLCTAGYVCFDANNDKKITSNEIFRVFGGTLTVTDTYTEYHFELENGKAVSGRNSAAFTKTLPPS
jgi:hypothetical protein